jgi:membrane protease YdiL (CAAX protease family)
VNRELATTEDNLLGQLSVSARAGKQQKLFLLAILAAITVCEYLFVYSDVVYAIGLALFLALGIYATISVFHLNQPTTDSAGSLAVIPLYILFTSSLPWFFINQQYLLPAVYSIIIALSLWHIYQNKLSLKALLGLRKEKLLRYILAGIAIGAVLGTGEYFILRPAPAFPAFEMKYLLRDMIYMFLFVGLGEEILFRGLIQRDLMKSFGGKTGLILASMMFAVMHLTWRSLPELGFVFIAGLILGAFYWKTKSLTLPVIAHGANNVMLVAVLPYILG